MFSKYIDERKAAYQAEVDKELAAVAGALPDAPVSKKERVSSKQQAVKEDSDNSSEDDLFGADEEPVAITKP